MFASPIERDHIFYKATPKWAYLKPTICLLLSIFHTVAKVLSKPIIDKLLNQESLIAHFL